MQVNVLFFGVLAEVSGTYLKCYYNARSISDLKLMIQDDFPEIVHYNFNISYNNELTDKELLLNSGDKIAFIPSFNYPTV